MSTTRTINKYPNRRLYDTVDRRYVTLSDIRQLVLEGSDFVVVDRKSEDDITCKILLQIIYEREAEAEAMFSQGFLTDVIRAYAAAPPARTGRYLHDALLRYLRHGAEAASERPNEAEAPLPHERHD